MNLSANEEENPREIHLPAEVDWAMLDKSRFFILGAALFSGVSATLYPAVVLKTRQQVSSSLSNPSRCSDMALLMLRQEGFRSFYRGFGTSLTGTIPARALYMAALEVTKTNVSQAGSQLGLSDPTTAAVASAAGGLSASVAAQLVWTPVDVVSQRLMVQGHHTQSKSNNNRIVAVGNNQGFRSYGNGMDCCRKIVRSDGIRGLYRGFGISILTYAPSSAVWWGSYSLASRVISGGIGCYRCNEEEEEEPVGGSIGSSLGVVGVQAVSAGLASGISALVTMPLDTIKTRLQVLDQHQDGHGGGIREGNWRQTAGRGPTVRETVKGLMKEGGIGACYRGLGPRWASMSVSAATMVTTYEFLKKMSAKHQEL